ncbi:ankyrin, partial [Lentithecium fluviatile CBS 122367]
LLLRLGCSLEARNSWGRSPLHEATLERDLDALATLLQRYPDLEAKDKHGKTVISYALSMILLLQDERIQVNSFSGSYGGDHGTALHLSARIGHVEATRLLLQHKEINPNLQNSEGNTPLHCA